MVFQRYREEDYEELCVFLIELNRNGREHINWNWARFEWMHEHPEFDGAASSSIGLWRSAGKLVGAAIYDMYFGEAFCAVLPGFESLYPEILEYAYRELKDDSGLGVAISDTCGWEIEAAKAMGFSPSEQTETVLKLELDRVFMPELPTGLHIAELDPGRDAYAFQWLLWQGFDHGMDRSEFEKKDPIIPQIRRHLDPSLSIAAVDQSGEMLSYCCLWHQKGTDYAYIEPVCTVPSARGKGIARALLHEAFKRVKAHGAERAYVISDMDFYKQLGFSIDRHYTFYWK